MPLYRSTAARGSEVDALAVGRLPKSTNRRRLRRVRAGQARAERAAALADGRTLIVVVAVAEP
jgi:hypothetical protein